MVVKMQKEKKYFFCLDVIRLVSCIAILFYHLGILKGGYLAVCTFFVLSGYLSCASCFRKEKFSFFNYYKNKFLNIYLPLLVVSFLTVLIVPLFHNINWINLKPETTSVIFGYNNFWQLNANLDYFAHHVDSPFMHFWYLGILMQFDIVFPFVFFAFKKMGDKLNKLIPCILTLVLAILGAIYFYYASINHSLMVVYYNTFTRVFSLLFGVFLGFIHGYYKNIIPGVLKNKIVSILIFSIYLILLILAFITIQASNKYFNIVMLLVTFISLRLVDYGTFIIKDKINVFDKIIKYLSGISYEVYLVQYPVIFIVQYTSFKKNILISILITVILSCIIHFILDIKNKRYKYVRVPVFIVLMLITLFGGYKYVVSKDFTNEMKELEDTLNKNEEIMNQKREEYLSRQQQEQEEWNMALEDLKKGEEDIKEYVSNLPIIGVGDSVMLGAVDGLYNTFPNGYFDAKVSRTDYEANDVLTMLKANGMLGNPIIFNLGTNGQCGSRCRDVVLNTIEDRQLYLVTVTNDHEVYVNDDLINYANSHDNVHIIDWNNLSKGHPEYFIADGIHLTPTGVDAYVNTIYNEIYQHYLDEYNAKKEEILFNHEQKEKEKITFFGNDLLLNEDIMNYYSEAKFVVSKDFNYESLVEELNKEVQNNTLTYRIVLAFDSTLSLTQEQYEKIIELCKNHEIYIILINDSYELNANIIDLKSVIDSNNNYLMIDKIHLTDDGNEALLNLLKENIK